MKKSVVIIEDEVGTLESLEYLLAKDDFKVYAFPSAEDFFMSTKKPENAIYLIDWNLPGIKGIDIIRAIRKTDKLSPVFMLTAYSDDEQMLLALKDGVDDYIVKPFNYDALLLKVRNAAVKMDHILKKSVDLGLHFLPESHSIIKDGVTVNLTNTEYAILTYLFKMGDTPSTREQLLTTFEVPSSDESDFRNIDVHVYSLRKKVVKLKISIETVRGIGYKISSVDEEA